MSAGTFTTYNKRRPGAYINIKAVNKPSTALGDRGVVLMAVSLGWGKKGEFIDILSSDFFAGKYIDVLGYDPFAPELQAVREVLKYAYKVILYIADVGTAATATIGGITCTAKCKGTRGNAIKVEIKTSGSNKEVITYVDTNKIDSQTVSAIAELKENAYVVFSGTGSITATVATPLTSGADGTATSASFNAFFTGAEIKKFQVVCVACDVSGIPLAVKSFVEKMREQQGKKIQGVVYNDVSANYEGIIAVKQGYKTVDETVSPVNFVATVAGITASAGVGTSNTYKVIDGAIEITGEMNDSDIITALSQGWLLLSKRVDGAVVIEQDINTLVSYSATKSEAMSKNRTMRALDELANAITLKYQLSYIGKINNDENGRNLFKGDVIGICSEMSKNGAIKPIDIDSDIQVIEGKTKDSIIVELSITTLDAMEKLYMTINVK